MNKEECPTYSETPIMDKSGTVIGYRAREEYPTQIWLIGPNDDPPTWTADDMLVSYSGPAAGVRYLRADLTCGGCGKRKKVCAHFNPQAPKKAGRYSPACMAFVPKEAK